jgi:hypothetical protein
VAHVGNVYHVVVIRVHFDCIKPAVANLPLDLLQLLSSDALSPALA